MQFFSSLRTGTLLSLVRYARSNVACTSTQAISLGVPPQQSVKIFLDAAKSFDFTSFVTDNTSGGCGLMGYQVTVSKTSGGTGANGASLITLADFASASLSFAASTSSADYGTYSVQIQAGFYSEKSPALPTSWIASTTATQIYVDPCNTAILSFSPAPSDMTYTIAASAQTQTVSSNLAISPGELAGYCGSYAYVQILDASSTATTVLNGAQLAISSDGVISVSTSSVANIGTHTIDVAVRLASYQSATQATATFTVTITACLVTSVQVTKSDGTSSLQSSQKLAIPSSSPLSINIKAILTPACGYSVSAFKMTAISADNPTYESSFTTVTQDKTTQVGTTRGTYSAGPFIDALGSEAGTYQIQFTSLTLSNAQIVTSFSGTSQFSLVVTNQCASTILSWVSSPQAMSYSISAFASTQTVSATNAVQASNITGTSNICGSYTYSVSDGSGTLSSTELTISSSGVISVATTNVLAIGTHTVTVKIALTSYSAVTAILNTFTLSVTECVVTGIQIMESDGLTVLSAQTYAIQNASAFSYVVSVVQTPACGYSATAWASIVSPSTLVYSIQQTGTDYHGTLTTGPFRDVSEVGTYSVSFVSVTLNGVAVPNMMQTSPFQLIVYDACSSTIPTVSASSIVYSVLAVAGTQTATFTDSVSLAFSTPEFCGGLTYLSVGDAPVGSVAALTSSEMTISMAGVVSVSTNNAAAVGTHTVTIAAQMTNDVSIVTSTTFTLTITACEVTSVQILKASDSSVLVAQSYAIPSSAAFTLQVQAVQTPACGYPLTAGVFTSSSALALSLTVTAADINGMLTIGPFSDISEVGTYMLTFSQVTLNSVQVTSFTGVNQFALTVTNACLTTALQWPPTTCLASMTYSILATTNVKTACQALDAVSSSLSTAGLCGTFFYQISTTKVSATTDLTLSEVKIQGSKISVQTSNVATIGTHLVTVTQSLSSQPSITISRTFPLTITACVVTNVLVWPLNLSGYLQEQKYAIPSSVAFSKVFKVIQTPQCGYLGTNWVLNVTSSDNQAQQNSFSTMKSSGTALAVYSAGPFSSVAQVGTYQVQITSVDLNGVTVFNYDYYFGSFSLIVYNACQTTTLSLASNLTAMTYTILSDTTTTQTVPVVQDEVSAGNGQSGQCGGLTYSISSTPTSSQTALSQSQLTISDTGLISVQRVDSKTVGTHMVTATLFLSLYKNVTTNQTFTLTIAQTPALDLPSVNLTPIQESVNQTYSIGNANSPIKMFLSMMLQYYNVFSTSGFQLQFQVTQISGRSLQSFNMDQSWFVLNVTDPSFAASNASFQFFVTTNIKGQISNNQLKMFVSFDSASYNQSQSANQLKSTFVPHAKNASYNQLNINPFFKPAWISEITTLGLTTIHFYQSVYVPIFANQNNKTFNATSRRLAEDSNITLAQFMDTDVLNITLLTSQGKQTVNWVCQNFTSTQLMIKLQFNDPLEVSSGRIDTLVVNFIDPSLFVLNTTQQDFFQNSAQQQMTFNVPPQFASQKAEAVFSTVSSATTQGAISALVVTLLLALQIILLVNENSKIQLPASVQLFSTTISGIVNLSSFDKKAAAEKLHLANIQNSTLYQNLSGVSIAIILIVGLIGIILVARCLVRNKKVLLLLLKVKDFLFWNFLIRFFQASLINLNFSSLKSVLNKTIGDMTPSILILTTQYGIVIYIALYLLRKPLEYLDNENTRKIAGNLYPLLDATQRHKVMFGIAFYLQRCCVVLLMVMKIDGGIQWLVLDTIILLNSVFLFSATPYTEYKDSFPDKLNSLLLLLTSNFYASLLSAWIPTGSQRFQNGIYFDAFLGLALILNFSYVIGIAIRPVTLRLKRARVVFKRKAEQARKLKERIEKPQQEDVLAEIEIPKNKLVSAVSKSSLYDQMLTIQTKKREPAMRLLKQATIQPSLIVPVARLSELSEIEDISRLVSIAEESDYYSCSDGQEEPQLSKTKNENQILKANLLDSLNLKQDDYEAAVWNHKTSLPFEKDMYLDELYAFKAKRLSLSGIEILTRAEKEVLEESRLFHLGMSDTAHAHALNGSQDALNHTYWANLTFLGQKSIDFLQRNPKKRDYLNRFGLERATSWEITFKKICDSYEIPLRHRPDLDWRLIQSDFSESADERI